VCFRPFTKEWFVQLVCDYTHTKSAQFIGAFVNALVVPIDWYLETRDVYYGAKMVLIFQIRRNGI
jgi:hypothetical protein